MEISMTVNGETVFSDVEPRTLLVHLIRELGLTGTNIGCETATCGACTVHVDGTSRKSCSLLAVQTDGARVVTIEGLGSEEQPHPLQEAFRECHALQCGYCTPGMIMQAAHMLDVDPAVSGPEIRRGLQGNLCRCTGYHNIVRAVERAGAVIRDGRPPSAEGAV